MKQAKLPYNSANRLLTILYKTYLLGQERPDLSVRDILSSAMQTKRNPAAFYTAWAKLFCLIEQLKKDILQLPEDKASIYSKAIQEIIKTISLTDFSNIWEESSEFKSTLNNPNWLGFHVLELCAIDLGNKEIEITPDKLKNFQYQIETMLQEVQNRELGLSLKAFLEDHLNQLQERIEYYQFYGSEGIRKSVEESLGALLLRNLEFEQTLEAEQKLLQNFLKLLKYLLNILVAGNLALPDKILDTLNLRILRASDSSI